MTFSSILYEVCYWSLWWGWVLRGNKWAAFMRLSVIMDLAVSFADSCKCLPDLWPVIFDGGGIDVSSANDCELLILSSGIWKCSCTCIDPDCFPLYSSKCFSVLLISHTWGLGCVSLMGYGKVLQESIIIQIHCVKQSLSKKERDSTSACSSSTW